MSIVYLPTCPSCGWTMRQVRVCERDETTRVRVFECARCRRELIWAPGANQSGDPARERRVPFGPWFR